MEPAQGSAAAPGCSSWRCRWTSVEPSAAGSHRWWLVVPLADAGPVAAAKPAAAGSAVRRCSPERMDQAGPGVPEVSAAGTGSAPDRQQPSDRWTARTMTRPASRHEARRAIPASQGGARCAIPRNSPTAAAVRRTAGLAVVRRTAAVVVAPVVGGRPAGRAASGRMAAAAPGRVRSSGVRSAATATGRDRGRSHAPARCRCRSPSGGAPRLSGSSVRSRTATATPRRRPGYRPTGSCQPWLHRPTVAEGECHRP